MYVLEISHEKIGVSHDSLDIDLTFAENCIHSDHGLDALRKVTYVADASTKETLDGLEPINMHPGELASEVVHLSDSNRMTVLIIDGPNQVILEVIATANVVDVVLEI